MTGTNTSDTTDQHQDAAGAAPAGDPAFVTRMTEAAAQPTTPVDLDTLDGPEIDGKSASTAAAAGAGFPSPDDLPQDRLADT